jgi:hypothetical protein
MNFDITSISKKRIAAVLTMNLFPCPRQQPILRLLPSVGIVLKQIAVVADAP